MELVGSIVFDERSREQIATKVKDGLYPVFHATGQVAAS